MGLGRLPGWGLAFCERRERQVEKFRERLEGCEGGGDSGASPPPIVWSWFCLLPTKTSRTGLPALQPERVGRPNAPGSHSGPWGRRTWAVEEGTRGGLSSGREGFLQTALRSTGLPCRGCGGQGPGTVMTL